jgi:Fe-S cluster assembly scaffold protein SufB
MLAASLAPEGNAAYACGHVDCLEIVRDGARVSALPEVRVTHLLAKVTHEGAIASVDHRQLETLMSRGVAPEEAVDIIVREMLRRPDDRRARLPGGAPLPAIAAGAGDARR